MYKCYEFLSTIPIHVQHGIKLSFNNLLCNNPIRWYQALSNEFGRPTQSNDAGVRCTNAMNFIHYSQIPSNSKVTYTSFVCDHRPLKSEQWRAHLVVEGNKSTCPYDTGSPAGNKTPSQQCYLRFWQRCTFQDIRSKRSLPCFINANSRIFEKPQKYIPQDIINKYNLK